METVTHKNSMTGARPVSALILDKCDEASSASEPNSVTSDSLSGLDSVDADLNYLETDINGDDGKRYNNEAKIMFSRIESINSSRDNSTLSPVYDDYYHSSFFNYNTEMDNTSFNNNNSNINTGSDQFSSNLGAGNNAPYVLTRTTSETSNSKNLMYDPNYATNYRNSQTYVTPLNPMAKAFNTMAMNPSHSSQSMSPTATNTLLMSSLPLKNNEGLNSNASNANHNSVFSNQFKPYKKVGPSSALAGMGNGYGSHTQQSTQSSTMFFGTPIPGNSANPGTIDMMIKILASRYIAEYRTSMCATPNCQDIANKLCLHAHNVKQLRRSPFAVKNNTSIEKNITDNDIKFGSLHGLANSNNGSFSYHPQRCVQMVQHNSCDLGNACMFAHNADEVNFHPLMYKTQLCEAKNQFMAVCSKNGRHCWNAHNYLELRDVSGVANCYQIVTSSGMVDEKSNGNLFNIYEYKTFACTKAKCNKATCDGFHDPKERRRMPHVHFYSSDPCPNVYFKKSSVWSDPSTCSNHDQCTFSHTLFEKMYHRKNFKTKVCERYANNFNKCNFESRCAYIHGTETLIDYFSPPPTALPKNDIDNVSAEMSPDTNTTSTSAENTKMTYAAVAINSNVNSPTDGSFDSSHVSPTVSGAEKLNGYLIKEMSILNCSICRTERISIALYCGHLVCQNCLGCLNTNITDANGSPVPQSAFSSQPMNPINKSPSTAALFASTESTTYKALECQTCFKVSNMSQIIYLKM